MHACVYMQRTHAQIPVTLQCLHIVQDINVCTTSYQWWIIKINYSAVTEEIVFNNYSRS